MSKLDGIKEAWRGEATLFRAFWVYPLAYGAAFLVTTLLLMMVLSFAFGLDISQPGDKRVIARIWLCLFIPFFVWMYYSIWKCSTNTSKKIWTIGARMFAMVTATQLLMMPLNEQSAIGKLIYGSVNILSEADAAYIENCKQVFVDHYVSLGFDPANFGIPN